MNMYVSMAQADAQRTSRTYPILFDSQKELRTNIEWENMKFFGR